MRGEHLHVVLPVPTMSPVTRLRNLYLRRFPGTRIHRVHFVYLVPTDKQPVATSAIERAAVHFRRWCRWQMGNGKTFSLCQPIVEVYRTAHPSSWYSLHNAGGDNSGWYWANALQELHDQCGGGFYQEFDDWCVYLDAAPGPGQYAGGTSGGFISGVCVLGDRDVASVQELDPEWTLCRGIGGCGHELLHTFGLPHPDGHPDWERAIMGIGYMFYSNDILLQADKDRLNANPFFGFQRPDYRTLKICLFDDHLRPPHPTPVPRPT